MKLISNHEIHRTSPADGAALAGAWAMAKDKLLVACAVFSTRQIQFLLIDGEGRLLDKCAPDVHATRVVGVEIDETTMQLCLVEHTMLAPSEHERTVVEKPHWGEISVSDAGLCWRGFPGTDGDWLQWSTVGIRQWTAQQEWYAVARPDPFQSNSFLIRAQVVPGRRPDFVPSGPPFTRCTPMGEYFIDHRYDGDWHALMELRRWDTPSFAVDITPRGQTRGEIADIYAYGTTESQRIVWWFYNKKIKRDKRDASLWFGSVGADHSAPKKTRLIESNVVLDPRYHPLLDGRTLMTWTEGLGWKTARLRYAIFGTDLQALSHPEDWPLAPQGMAPMIVDHGGSISILQMLQEAETRDFVLHLAHATLPVPT
ncbi:hypothetical protein [Variovorax paradoxus]|uniref:hypothetical protein n=1 Tax=Variovorax paradoxus TaxID=34073 RepID=UPI003D65AE3D